MRAHEFIWEDASTGGTSSGSIASVAGSLSHMPLVTRMTRPPTVDKYRVPQQPRTAKRKKNVSKLS
jgi:hypothetical protein